MRHQVAGKHLSRTSAHRRALRRNLAASLFEHGTITTTIEKAKFVRPFAEKLITMARNGSLAARRRVIALLQDRRICKVEKGEPVQTGTVIQKLFNEIGPSFAERNGGYTRIIRLPWRRVGDNGKLVMLQLVTESVTISSKHRQGSGGEKVSDVPEQPVIVEEAGEGTDQDSTTDKSVKDNSAIQQAPVVLDSEVQGEPQSDAEPEEKQES